MIVPLGSRLLVEPLKEEQTTKSGILLGDSIAPQSIKMKILAVGPEAKGFSIGEVVFVSQYAPTECRETIADKSLTVPCEDVIAKVK